MDEKDKMRKALQEAVKYVESSGGKNVNHPVITKGVSAGDKALGAYGLTPNTIREMLKRHPENPYSHLKDEDLADVYEKGKLVPEVLRPDVEGIEGAVSKNLAEHVLTKQKGNIEQALASWLMGHNKSPSEMAEIVQRNPAAKKYVEKAMPVYKKSFPKVDNLILKKQEDDEDENEE